MEIQKREEVSNGTMIFIQRNLIYSVLKRAIDIIGALVGLILLSPVLFVIAVLIKLNDPKGSVLFSQERVGKNQEVFRIYKFRSMYADAEARLEELLKYNEVEGAMFKMKEDPRITSIGKYLRELSLDELPQLLNVLKGDMSLVGPRPPLVREVNEYTDHHKQRLLVQPGITGLWQVSGRNALSFEQMVELDLQYITNANIWKDIQILVKTVKVVLKSENAY